MRKITIGLLGTVAGATIVGKLANMQTKDIEKKREKFKNYYNMLNQWLNLKQQGRTLDEWFEKRGYKKIAIYGMGEMGNRLIDELGNSDIEIEYGIDKDATSIYSKIKVIDINDITDDVDVMIVTATFAMDSVVEAIKDNLTCPIISLEDVVYEM